MLQTEVTGCHSSSYVPFASEKKAPQNALASRNYRAGHRGGDAPGCGQGAGAALRCYQASALLAESWGQGADIPVYHQFTFCFPI